MTRPGPHGREPRDRRDPLLQRGDGRRHRGVPDERLRPVGAAGRGARRRLHADLFNIANTIPNMLYILLAGGIFNAVLVPQLVRAMKHDADGGDAYTNRMMTLAGLFLGVVTVLLVVAAPWVMPLYLDPTTAPPSWPRSASRSSTSPASACRRCSSTACSCWSGRSSTPAAGSAR